MDLGGLPRGGGEAGRVSGGRWAGLRGGEQKRSRFCCRFEGEKNVGNVEGL